MAEVSEVWKVIEHWMTLQQFPPNQSQLAKSLRVVRSAVSDWKWGKTRPSPEHVQALADLMAPTLGPRARDMLVVAIMQDQGYPFDSARELLGIEVGFISRDKAGRVVRYGRQAEELPEVNAEVIDSEVVPESDGR